jgi:putative hydrolase of the HAD superfamily
MENMSETTPIKAILFDFGQVLNAAVDVAAVAAHRAEMAAKLGLEPEELWPYLFTGELALAWMSGRMASEQYWIEILAAKGITDPEDVAAFAAGIFKGSEEIHPEMVALLQELHGRYKLGVISNADWTEEVMRRDFLSQFGLSDLFEVVVTSASSGAAKPDPAIYQLALQRLAVRPEEAIFTDDLALFTEAAAALGMHAFTFTTPEAFRRYLVEMGVLDDSPGRGAPR